MTKYTVEQVLQASRAAYRSSMAGSDSDYVERKSQLFVVRCLNFDGQPEDKMISQEAVREIAFAALDPYCTAQLYSVLDSFYN